MNIQTTRRAGFTLIELLVVVLILAILLAVAIPLYLSSVKNSGARTVQANLKTVALAAQAYRLRNGSYPADYTTGTVPTAFISASKDLEFVPNGPRGVTYTWQTSTAADASIGATAAGQFIVIATESATGSDVFDDPATTNQSLAYNLTTGLYTPSSPSPSSGTPPGQGGTPPGQGKKN